MTPTSPEPGHARRGPLVIAHRGSSAALPEHTLGAYLRAIDEGADGLECDVRLTRDGHLVCIHDRRLDRVSNGTGRVSRLNLAELDEFDFGRWHPHAAKTGGADVRTRVLTLERLLAAAFDAGRPLRLLIETKHPTRFGGEVEDRLVAMLRAHGIDRSNPTAPVSATVMSFSALAVRRMRELAPTLDTVFLAELFTPGLRDGRLPFGAKIGGPGVRLVKANPTVVARLHGRGHRVYVWTVNEPDELELMVETGVDAVITDRPRLVLDLLGR